MGGISSGGKELGREEEGTDAAVAFGLVFAAGEGWGGCAEG